MLPPASELRKSWLRAWWVSARARTASQSGMVLLLATANRTVSTTRSSTCGNAWHCSSRFKIGPCIPPKWSPRSGFTTPSTISGARTTKNEAPSGPGRQRGKVALPGKSPSGFTSLVLVTKHTGVPAGADEQLLGRHFIRPPGCLIGSRFADHQRRYSARIRAGVPDGQFRQRRRAILGSFLERPRIYSTPHFHDLEAAARANLRAALDAS